MSNNAEKTIVRVEFQIAAAVGTGWTSVTVDTANCAELDYLRSHGRILEVKVREDATLNDCAVGSFYICDGRTGKWDGASTPDDLDVIYSYTGVTFTGHATTASINDALGGTSPYAYYWVPQNTDLRIGINVTTAGGGGASTLLYCLIVAEVEV